jgi:hypothetical protein
MAAGPSKQLKEPRSSFRLSQMQFGVVSSTLPITDKQTDRAMMRAATEPGTIGAYQPRHPALRWHETPIGELGHDEFVGYSTPRNLNERTYTLGWVALSLDTIDRKHASTYRRRCRV